MLLISAKPIQASRCLESFEKEASGAGAIVSFTGQVRASAENGAVTMLNLQAYSPMTEDGIASVIVEAEKRWPLHNTMVVHRTGEMRPGETIVFVATASKHRRAAFEAADFLMDYLKTKAIFWKQESTEGVATWIEPRSEDYTDAARWET